MVCEKLDDQPKTLAVTSRASTRCLTMLAPLRIDPFMQPLRRSNHRRLAYAGKAPRIAAHSASLPERRFMRTFSSNAMTCSTSVSSGDGGSAVTDGRPPRAALELAAATT